MNAPQSMDRRSDSGHQPNRKRRAVSDKMSRFFRVIYLRLFRVHDTPQKIALGFGLGVFLGVMPGTGILAAIFFAVIFRVNRAAALLGSVFTNTWLSIPLFLLSVKLGAVMTGSSLKDISNQWSLFVKDFSWINLFQISVYKIIFPVMVGYGMVSLCAGFIAYLAVLIVIKRSKSKPFTG